MGASEGEPSKTTTHKNDRKLGMSCAECRRSKLKCDRTFPCSACVRRGCANICPDGILAATKGNKVLQTQNETLLQTVRRMSARIRDLEAALGNTQAQISPQPHPLLQDSERLKETDMGLYDDSELLDKEDVEEASELVGSLSIGDQGQTRFHGQSTASEFLQTLLPGSKDDPALTLHSGNMYKMGLPIPIIDLINAFPFNSVTPDPDAKSIILRFLPHHSKALGLTLSYFENASCSYQVVQQDDFVARLLRILRLVSNGLTIGESLHAHEVALIYLILAMGSHLGEDDNGRAVGEKFYHLACAALSLNPIMKEATSTTLQALFVMVQYFNCIDSPSCERRWLVAGIMFRLSYIIGLQRDPGLWNLSPEETQRRRALFWEMYTWDAWHSIIHGRPPSLNIKYTDCRFPEDKSPVYNEKGEKEMGFESYKHRFAAFILAPVLDHVFGVRELNYGSLLEVDLKLRKLPPPSWLLSPTRGRGEPVDGRAWNSNSMRAMQQYHIVCARESTLLYIHRRYFATAIKLNSSDPLKTKYGASVMAACRSACLLLSGLRSLYGVYPNVASKQSFFWSGAFSACIVLGCLVYNSPGCSLATDALRAIDDGVELYSLRVFEDSSSSVKLLSSVRDNVRRMFEGHQKLHERKVHDPKNNLDCSTMRVLEGHSVLINLNDVKATPSSSGSDGSSPSAQSDPPDIPVDQSAAAHVPRIHGEDIWPTDSGNENTIRPPEYGTFDFSGVHNGASNPHMRPSAPLVSQPSIYGSLNAVLNEHSVASAVGDAHMGEVNSMGPAVAQVGGLEGVQNLDAVYSALGDFGTESMLTEDATMLPYAGLGDQGWKSFETPANLGQAGLSNVAGSTSAVYDQASWEKFLYEMGVADPGMDTGMTT
ncbi:hypothetical protein M0805_005054 [Coniferiporia weirii]|nr:hypothetical protein M0805_005054 [Coniferiporia weirii]